MCSTGLAQRVAALAANGRDRLNPGHKLGDIIAVGARQEDGKRDTLCLGNQVMLGAGACTTGIFTGTGTWQKTPSCISSSGGAS